MKIKKIKMKNNKFINRILYFTLILAAIFILLFLQQCNKNNQLKQTFKKEQLENQQNILALRDSVVKEKNKNNYNSFSKAIAIMSKEEIKEDFPELYNKMEGEFGEVKYITKFVNRYIESGEVTNKVFNLRNGNYSLLSEYRSKDSLVYIKAFSDFKASTEIKDDSCKLIIKPNRTRFEEIRFNLSLTTGIKKDKKGIYKVFVVPDNPNVNVTNINGADISGIINNIEFSNHKKQKKWGIGPTVGYSVIFGKNNKVYHGISFGIGIHYSILKF